MAENSRLVNVMASFFQNYNHSRYWKMRDYVVGERGIKLLKLLYLFRIKRMDAFNGASLGTHLGYGAKFAGIPFLPHGIRGIIISHNAEIGKNVTIYHQVTIGEGKGGAPIIGNNVMIGPGVKIVGKVKVGDNVKIGANCVIAGDIPPNATVVTDKPRILLKTERQ